MIVKIWPIKGVQGLKQAKLYIEDDNKVIKIDLDEEGKPQRRTVIDTHEQHHMNADRFFIENEENIDRVLNYMANEDKIKNKFISGYKCNVDTALEDFRETWDHTLRNRGAQKRAKNLDKETMSFHLVQSFPEDLDISDEEVHECGLELLKKLEKHQGIVCSHVHPVMDEDGKLHGKSKHNHILINAFMEPDMIDPEHPNRVKYNDCIETYEMLRVWNDEIAIDHGLPIILDPDKDRVYSWYENYEAKRGHSWKERIRMDIEAARRVTNNWDEFVSFMKETGYQIRDGKHVTYTAPDGEHKARGDTLGTSYTKESLQLYWTIRDRVELAVDKAVKDNAAPPLWSLATRYGTLTVDIPLGGLVEGERPTYHLSLSKTDLKHESLVSYFHDKDLYDIKDAYGHVVASATGREVIDYLDALSREDDRRWMDQQRAKEDQERKDRWQREEEERRRKDEEQQKKNAYSAQFRNSRSKQYYYVDLRDQNGRRRSSLELVFLLAIVVLKNEDGLWTNSAVPEGKENEAIFGPIDWKIQNMMDAIHIASEEGLESPAQLDERLHESGAEFSRARSAYNKTKNSIEKMEALDRALSEFEDTKELAERIQALPEGEEKKKLQEQYMDEIARYKAAKAVMYAYKTTTPERIEDFRRRYTDMKENLPSFQEQYEKTKQDYTRLKKLKYNVTLAQNEQYCYGPDYGVERTAVRDDQDQNREQK